MKYRQHPKHFSYQEPQPMIFGKKMKKQAYLSAGSFIAYNLQPSQNQYDVNGTANSFVNLYRAAWVAIYSVYDYHVSLKGLDYKTDEYYKVRSICHQRSAERILWLSKTCRGIYFKGGQYIGNLDKIVPQEFAETLQVLQDSGPKEDIHAIKTVIEYDTKKKMDELFSWFDHDAIAAASLAQVHRAHLKENNKLVAVKVQFPTLRAQYCFDFFFIEGSPPPAKKSMK